MRLFIFSIILYFGRVAFSCHKNIDPVFNTSDSTSVTINLKNCFSKTFGTDNITVCFDSVLSDSRCPSNVNCIWAGTAISKFTFSKNGTVYPFNLSTLKFNSYSPDTTLSGYKIKFLNLLPYPGTSLSPVPASDIKAVLRIYK